MISLPSSRPTKTWLCSLVTETQRTATRMAMGSMHRDRLYRRNSYIYYVHISSLRWDKVENLSELKHYENGQFFHLIASRKMYGSLPVEVTDGQVSLLAADDYILS